MRDEIDRNPELEIRVTNLENDCENRSEMNFNRGFEIAQKHVRSKNCTRAVSQSANKIVKRSGAMCERERGRVL